MAHLIAPRLVDEIVVKQTTDELRTFMQQAHQKNLLLDLSDVVDFSRAMLKELMTLQFSIENAGGRLRLCKVGRRVGKIFAIMGVDHMFDIETEAAYVAKASQSDRALGVA